MAHITREKAYEILKKYTRKIQYIDLKNIIKIIIGLVFKRKLIVEGLNSGNIIKDAIKEVCNDNNVKNINDLKIPVIIPAVNLKNGQLIVFSSHSMIKNVSDNIRYVTNVPIDIAVRSSCSYPGVFNPYNYDNSQLVDGGIRANVPWKELKQIGADNILAINFATETQKTDTYDNMIEIAIRSMSIMDTELANCELQGLDNLITITTKKVGLLESSQINYLYEKGYKTAKKYIDEKIK